jgi:hypothetical protein
VEIIGNYRGYTFHTYKYAEFVQIAQDKEAATAGDDSADESDGDGDDA